MAENSPDEVYRPPFVANEAGQLNRFKKVWLLDYFRHSDETLRNIADLSLNADDVVVSSFPKSGTTWLQYIVLLITTADSLNADDLRNIDEIFWFLEFKFPGLDEIARRPSPRLIKSHLPYDCLPSDVSAGKSKVLYVARNPKDVCVSYYHFVRAMYSMYSYSGQFDDFCEQFVSGRVNYGPYVDHLSGYWNHRNDKNMLIIRYEDLYQEPENVIRQIANYLDRSLTDEQLTEIVRRSTFDAMKNNSKVNYSWFDALGWHTKDDTLFMRKGIVGDWKNYMTADMERKIYETCVEPLEKQGLTFTDS